MDMNIYVEVQSSQMIFAMSKLLDIANERYSNRKTYETKLKEKNKWKPCINFGSGVLGKIRSEYFESNEVRLWVFLDDDEKKNTAQKCNVTVLGSNRWAGILEINWSKTKHCYRKRYWAEIAGRNTWIPNAKYQNAVHARVRCEESTFHGI
jgi:FlaA1/EpsC-like NDP-sugar epimerase